MYSINGTTIKMTRGDTLIAQVQILQDGEVYTPVEGDVVRFALKHDKLNASKTAYVDDNPVCTKEIPISTMILKLDPEDTQELDFGAYVYDIQITFADGKVDTFITQAKFTVLPEVD